MEPDLALRIVVALTAAGLLLFTLEAFFPASGFAVFGGLSALASIGIAFRYVSIDSAAILFLIHSTYVSVGFLILLAWFPRLPLAARFLTQAAARKAAEEEKEDEEES